MLVWEAGSVSNPNTEMPKQFLNFSVGKTKTKSQTEKHALHRTRIFVIAFVLWRLFLLSKNLKHNPKHPTPPQKTQTQQHGVSFSLFSAVLFVAERSRSCTSLIQLTGSIRALAVVLFPIAWVAPNHGACRKITLLLGEALRLYHCHKSSSCQPPSHGRHAAWC